MGKEIIMFDDIKIEKFRQYKSPIFLEDVDINNIIVSNKIFSGEKNYKYFIDCMCDDYNIELLHKILLKASAYLKS